MFEEISQGYLNTMPAALKRKYLIHILKEKKNEINEMAIKNSML
jgi:hypothetical protein